jgi:uncharacterized membrane protein YccF (DUF307 family)
MTLILNILWFIFGGWIAGLAWLVSRRAVTGREDLGTGPTGCLLNVVWFLLGGWYIALAHLVIGVVQLVLIITIPFGLQHLKLAAIALAPIGKEVIET